MDKFGHFRMRAQRLWAGVMPSPFGLCEQGMDWLVTSPVHESISFKYTKASCHDNSATPPEEKITT